MNFQEKDMAMLLKAITFAAENHSHHRRKDPKASPYINHPIQVAVLLWEVGHVRDINIIVSAILHDIIEDTSITPEEIEAIFGKSVMEMVLEVTDDKTLPKAERKRLQIVNAPHKSDGARQIKLADKISNVMDIDEYSPTDWSLQRKREYLDWSEKVVAGLRGINPKLEAYYDDVLKLARRRV